MKIAIIGNRDLTDHDWISDTLTKHIKVTLNTSLLDIVVLLGGAKGVQVATQKWCTDNLIDYIVIPPAHMIDKALVRHFSPRMFFMRNKHIIDQADRVLFIKTDVDDGEVVRAMEYAEKVKPDLMDVIMYN